MNTQSKMMPEAAGKSSLTSAPVTPMRTLLWSVRRELWENRFIYLAPLAVAGVFLLGFLVTLPHLPARMRALSATENAAAVHMHTGAIYSPTQITPYDFAAGLMMLTTIMVGLFYCLDALHSERRDRSILFWKSLPVSDGTVVVAKASVPFVILPLLATALGSALHLIMLTLSSVILMGSGQSAAALWTELPWFKMSFLLFYHIITAHALWPAPVYSWLLLVSGWARRAAFLWATLPVIAITALEQLLFHSWHFAIMVGLRLIGAHPGMSGEPRDVFPTDPMAHIMPGAFFSMPGLWIGFAVAAIFLYAAMRQRRYRGPV